MPGDQDHNEYWMTPGEANRRSRVGCDAGLAGVELVKAERLRQISKEGWTAEHDDEHQKGEMAFAASCYVKTAAHQTLGDEHAKHTNGWWPWGDEWWKPSDDPIRNLAKAGALIAAEIDRLQRKKAKPANGELSDVRGAHSLK